MVKAISGVMTVRFKNELVRNITIKIGYANAKVRPTALIDILSFFNYHYLRSTNAKTKHVHDQDAIALTALIKKTTPHASVQDVVTA